MDVLALLDRSAMVLGASGIGFAVLGALLYSSRAEIRCVATLPLRACTAVQCKVEFTAYNRGVSAGHP